MNIESNGSKFLGDPPDTLSQLLEVLAREPLDPRFEEYGNFFYAQGGPDGWGDGRPGFQAWGNFWRVSHVFRIDGTREELAELEAAIRANQETPAYKEARAIRAKEKADAMAKNAAEFRAMVTEELFKLAVHGSDSLRQWLYVKPWGPRACYDISPAAQDAIYSASATANNAREAAELLVKIHG